MEAFSLGVRGAVAPDELPTWLAVRGAANSAPALQEGEIIHNLEVVAQDVDMAALEVDRLIMMWWLPVRLGHREPDLGGDVAGVAAPGPKVKGPSALAVPSRLLHIVHGAALAECLCSYILCPAVHWDAFNAYLDTVLPVDVVGVAAFAPGGEVEVTSIVGEDLLTDQALPDRRVGEGDEVLLGEVLDHLELTMAQAQLTAEGVAEMMRLRVVAIALKPTHCSMVDELVTAPLDGTSGRHSTETTSRMPNRKLYLLITYFVLSPKLHGPR